MGTDANDSRPLYAQVRETLIERIRSGTWAPGQLIPNEFDIAAEFGVSQGTARKAIDTLAVDGLLVRRQGKGTFVVEHTPANVQFRFFHMYDASGRQVIPESPGAAPILRPATGDERRALKLTQGASVIAISRVRTRAGKPFSSERIALPAELFPNLAAMPLVPNTLYDVFQRNDGVLVARADDRLTATAADAELARQLEVAPGTPLLRIDRTAYDLDERPIEWRVTICRLDGAHYLARVR
jgi:GntR family transcriptional regulator